MKSADRKPWQADPLSVKTERVQFWTASGIMLTANCSRDQAREKVASGQCYVISDQAIGDCEDQYAFYMGD